jgi:hypothetical protein
MLLFAVAILILLGWLFADPSLGSNTTHSVAQGVGMRGKLLQVGLFSKNVGELAMFRFVEGEPSTKLGGYGRPREILLENRRRQPFDHALHGDIDTLRLTSQACQMFQQVLIQRVAGKNGELHTKLFEPFEILRHSNQGSNRKEKELGGTGRDFGIWLLR